MTEKKLKTYTEMQNSLGITLEEAINKLTAPASAPVAFKARYDLNDQKDFERLYLNLADRLAYEHEDHDEIVRNLLKDGRLFFAGVKLNPGEENIFIVRHLKQMARFAFGNFLV